MGANETAQAAKSAACDLGADLCGIAAAASFNGAPAGFQPTDIWSGTRSVLVFARKLPLTAMLAENPVPYTHVNGIFTQIVDVLTMELCLWLEARGAAAVPIPSDDPYLHWEANNDRGQGILSLRHAAHLAGLGVLGRNTLLWNNRYGNMLQIGAILTDSNLTSDKPASYLHCQPGCRLCLEACPVGALNGSSVDQQLCRPLSNFRTDKGYIIKNCHRCRSICPARWGSDNNSGD